MMLETTKATEGAKTNARIPQNKMNTAGRINRSSSCPACTHLPIALKALPLLRTDLLIGTDTRAVPMQRAHNICC